MVGAGFDGCRIYMSATAWGGPLHADGESACCQELAHDEEALHFRPADIATTSVLVLQFGDGWCVCENRFTSMRLAMHTSH